MKLKMCKKILLTLLTTLILTSCQTTKLSRGNKLEVLKEPACVVAIKSDVLETLTRQEADLILKEFSNITKMKLKYPQLAKKALNCGVIENNKNK